MSYYNYDTCFIIIKDINDHFFILIRCTLFCIDWQCYFNVTAADVIGEEVILKWYKDGHSAKGKSVFLEQMKKFVEWLENASEG